MSAASPGATSGLSRPSMPSMTRGVTSSDRPMNAVPASGSKPRLRGASHDRDEDCRDCQVHEDEGDLGSRRDPRDEREADRDEDGDKRDRGPDRASMGGAALQPGEQSPTGERT